MELVVQTILHSLDVFIHKPLFLPVVAISVVLIAVVWGLIVVLTAKPRAQNEVAWLMAQREDLMAKLMDAEEIGAVGSFSWNYKDPTLSFWSKEMYALFGLMSRPKPPALDSIYEFIHEEDRVAATEAWARAKRTQGNFAMDFRTVSPAGQVRFLQVRGKTVLNEKHGPASIHGVAHDVTKDKEVDKAKTEFVSLASHQLKTPLTSIKWLSELLLAPTSEPLTPKQHEYVSNIKTSCDHMVEMVNDLLNVSRIELGTLALTLEDFSINDLVKSVVAEQAHTAEIKHLEIHFSSLSTLPVVHADQKLVRMIAQNLLSNAIKYSKDNGVVEVELSLASTTRESIFMRVKDAGIGIPKGEQGKMFTKLYRASNAEAAVPDGTGLGLYVIKTILDKAGGGITFESEEGKGTTFYASIPVIWDNGTMRGTKPLA